MESSLVDSKVDENEIQAVPIGPVTHAQIEPGYFRLRTENIKTIEDVALVFEAVKFHFQEGHPFFDKLKERNLI